MRKPPISIYLITILGLILAILLIWEGLHMRLFLTFRDPEALWVKGLYEMGLDPLGFAWPTIVLGASWISALCGLWLKLPWGRWALWVVCILSLFYVQIGTILSALVLVVIFLPVSQRWMKDNHA